MKTEQIQYLLEVSRSGSISAAAQKLSISQTALSAVVKSTEEELGFPLFLRLHHGVKPTIEGEEALSIMEEIHGFVEKIKLLRETAAVHTHPVLTITSPTVHSALALPLNHAVEQQAPECSLEFKVVTGKKVGNMIMKNEGAIGVTYLNKRDIPNYKKLASKYKIRVEHLFTDHFYLLVRKDHPLANRDTLSRGEITNLDLAMLEHYNSNPGTLIYSKALGPDNRYITLPSVSLIKQSIVSRNTAGILTGCAIHYSQGSDSSLMKPILLKDLDRPNEVILCLIHRFAEDLQPQEKLVLDCIRSYFKALAPPPFAPEGERSPF